MFKDNQATLSVPVAAGAGAAAAVPKPNPVAAGAGAAAGAPKPNPVADGAGAGVDPNSPPAAGAGAAPNIDAAGGAGAAAASGAGAGAAATRCGAWLRICLSRSRRSAARSWRSAASKGSVLNWCLYCCRRASVCSCATAAWPASCCVRAIKNRQARVTDGGDSGEGGDA